ncbi:APC family permease [Methanofollis ethanolicus]|uniref:APC family permease n=1 Tax=Methanofollis ethanolicus TaxID=488124 RepID=UPI00191BFBC8|nr:APC family permease [Methanofollis ethanolicus]
MWVVAGICATTIAIVFAYCSYYVPRAGDPFAYVSEAFDDFYEENRQKAPTLVGG